MEITISGERILYVGPYEGISPYNQARLESIGFYDEESDFPVTSRIRNEDGKNFLNPATNKLTMGKWRGHNDL